MASTGTARMNSNMLEEDAAASLFLSSSRADHVKAPGASQLAGSSETTILEAASGGRSSSESTITSKLHKLNPLLQSCTSKSSTTSSSTSYGTCHELTTFTDPNVTGNAQAAGGATPNFSASLRATVDQKQHHPLYSSTRARFFKKTIAWIPLLAPSNSSQPSSTASSSAAASSCGASSTKSALVVPGSVEETTAQYLEQERARVRSRFVILCCFLTVYLTSVLTQYILVGGPMCVIWSKQRGFLLTTTDKCDDTSSILDEEITAGLLLQGAKTTSKQEPVSTTQMTSSFGRPRLTTSAGTPQNLRGSATAALNAFSEVIKEDLQHDWNVMTGAEDKNAGVTQNVNAVSVSGGAAAGPASAEQGGADKQGTSDSSFPKKEIVDYRIADAGDRWCVSFSGILWLPQPCRLGGDDSWFVNGAITEVGRKVDRMNKQTASNVRHDVLAQQEAGAVEHQGQPQLSQDQSQLPPSAFYFPTPNAFSLMNFQDPARQQEMDMQQFQPAGGTGAGRRVGDDPTSEASSSVIQLAASEDVNSVPVRTMMHDADTIGGSSTSTSIMQLGEEHEQEQRVEVEVQDQVAASTAHQQYKLASSRHFSSSSAAEQQQKRKLYEKALRMQKRERELEKVDEGGDRGSLESDLDLGDVDEGVRAQKPEGSGMVPVAKDFPLISQLRMRTPRSDVAEGGSEAHFYGVYGVPGAVTGLTGDTEFQRPCLAESQIPALLNAGLVARQDFNRQDASLTWFELLFSTAKPNQFLLHYTYRVSVPDGSGKGAAGNPTGLSRVVVVDCNVPGGKCKDSTKLPVWTINGGKAIQVADEVASLSVKMASEEEMDNAATEPDKAWKNGYYKDTLKPEQDFAFGNREERMEKNEYPYFELSIKKLEDGATVPDEPKPDDADVNELDQPKTVTGVCGSGSGAS
ncbi:unnamed protein product [Amoebophrya sp. A120]|nr:unnamed protein product [Amoebophrya sp. A120]|eukprot:GSA120T00023621001.1